MVSIPDVSPRGEFLIQIASRDCYALDLVPGGEYGTVDDRL